MRQMSLGVVVAIAGLLAMRGVAQASTSNFRQYASAKAMATQSAGVVFAGVTEQYGKGISGAMYSPPSGPEHLHDRESSQRTAAMGDRVNPSPDDVAVLTGGASHGVLSMQTLARGSSDAAWSLTLPAVSESMFLWRGARSDFAG